MNDHAKDVPYFVYESEAARHERTVKRLLSALIVTVLLMVITNMAWLYVWNQYDFSSEDVTIDSSHAGNAAYMGAGSNGVINYGQDTSEEEDSD